MARYFEPDERYTGAEDFIPFPTSDPEAVQEFVQSQREDFTGWVRLPQFTATQNNLSLPQGDYFRMSTDGVARAITGIAGAVNGRRITLFNTGGGAAIPLNNQDAGSTAEFRIITGTGAAVNIQPDRAAILIYDGDTVNPPRWRLVAYT